MTHVNKIPSQVDEIPRLPSGQLTAREQVLVNVISDRVSSIMTRIDASLNESAESVRRQNAYLSGPCDRIAAIFASVLRYIGLIR